MYETKLERNKQFLEKAFLTIKALLETEMTGDTFLNYFNLAEAATTSKKNWESFNIEFYTQYQQQTPH